jgi:uncharacterized protein (TIGR03086 family)
MPTTTRVELLERAIGYTRGNLVDVRDDLLGRPTPCSRWDLGTLLDHMVDALDAFAGASEGLVEVAPVRTDGHVLTVLRDKACTLLGAWSSPAATRVRVGDRALSSRRLLGAAALEVTLHGWDVGQATGSGRPVPEQLAAELLPVAQTLIGDADRPGWFGPVLPAAGSSQVARLLAFTGRQPLQHHRSHRSPGVA